MKMTAVSALPKKIDGLFVFVPESKWSKKPFGTRLPAALEKQIAARFAGKDAEGALGEVLALFPGEKIAQKTFLVGLGKDAKGVDVRKAAALAMRQAKKAKLKKMAFLLPAKLDLDRVISGAVLGGYEFKLGDTSQHFSPAQLTLITEQKVTKAHLASALALGQATNFTRDLVNLPASHMTPSDLAARARSLAKGLGSKVKVKVMGEKDLKKLKMGSFFGVGQGAHEESKFIILEYKGGKKADKPMVFLGKGVCFDSGGYNLKPTRGIGDMKSDMGGAATVLGLFHWLAHTSQKPKKNIIGVIGAVENLVSGKAYKPGDVLTSMSGKTIEITNTDAEGRLVLADCLYYTATKLKPALMVSAATLTGAAIAALGHEITAVLGNDQKQIDRLRTVAETVDEPTWQLPLNDTFRDKTKGTISDLVNWTANVSAGTAMAAAFLENFVEDTPWVHLDIAGTAFHSKGDELAPAGATGAMVRTFVELVK